MSNNSKKIAQIHNSWEADARWKAVRRPYTADQVLKLRGSIEIEHTLARMGAERLWKMLQDK